MAFSINGIGTTFYGHADVDPRDGSYITTEWVVFVYIPILPLRSMRVLPVVDDKPWYKQEIGQKYQSMKVPLLTGRG